MSAPRYGGRRDANQSDLLAAINSIPRVVAVDLGAVGGGVTDLLIGHDGINYLAEVKLDPVKGKVFKSQSKLNDTQIEWHALWPGQVAVVRNLEDVLTLLGIDYEG
jgi:hypothetical protein